MTETGTDRNLIFSFGTDAGQLEVELAIYPNIYKKSRDALIHEISESCKEIKIEMPSDDLVELRKFLTDNGIESETLEEVSPGYRREPTIIAIIVTAMPLAFSLLKEWLGSRHEEKITKTKLVAQLAGGGTQPMSLEKLESVSKIMSEKS